MDTLLATDYSDDRPPEAMGIRVAKRIVKSGFVGALVVLLSNWWVVYNTQKQTYFAIAALPANDVGLVLGTSKFVRTGKENLFFSLPHGSHGPAVERR